MAASGLIQDDDDDDHHHHIHPHVEVSVTATAPSSPAHPDGGPGRPASPPAADAPDGRSKRSKMSGLLQQNQLVQSLSSGLKRHCDYVKISMREERADRLPKEWWKTGVAFLYAVFNLIFTTVVITIVHERVPDKSVSPPLPDKFFDYVGRVPWAFTVTEVNGLILVGLWLVQWLLLKHR